MPVCAALLLCACTSIGPKTVSRDRFDYIDGVSDSWKRQTLLNIVKLRYADVPLFLDVAQIVSGYTLQSSIAAGANLSDAQDTLNLGVDGSYTDRPTITYSPLTGESFAKKLLSPIPPGAVLSLIQAGWAADLVLRTTVQAVNGQRNQSGLEPRQTPGDEDFYLLIDLLREIQRSGAFGMRVEERNDVKDTSVLFFYHESLDPNVPLMIASLKEVLGLDPALQRFKVAYGAIPRDDNEIAILTRSVIQIMMEIASYIDVPAEHLQSNRARDSTSTESDLRAKVPPLITISSGAERPDETFVSVQYADHWFWIDSSDFASKRIFTFLMLILMLSESGDEGKLPVLTIPAG